MYFFFAQSNTCTYQNTGRRSLLEQAENHYLRQFIEPLVNKAIDVKLSPQLVLEPSAKIFILDSSKAVLAPAPTGGDPLSDSFRL